MLRTDTDDQALSNLLFGAYRHRVLSLLFLRPGDRFHVRMIARLTGIPAGSLHRELRLLADAGLLVAERVGNQVHYSANEASRVFSELAAILEKTSGAPPTLNDHAEEHSIQAPSTLPSLDWQRLARTCRRFDVKKLSLFGPASRGELRPDSGVDLLVEFKRSGKTPPWSPVDMQSALSPLFGNRQIQIVGAGVMENPYRRKTIEPDLQVLYVARPDRR